MKFTPMILSVILATSTFGYGMASAQQVGAAGSGGGTPCTASQPCAPICGNHICAPGEVPGQNIPSSTKAAQSTNSTGSPNLATQVNIGTNVTATKTTANGTQSTASSITTGTASGTTTGTMTNGTMTAMTNGTMTNGTMTTGSMGTMPMTSTLPSPNAQVTAGAQPANVKCMSGYYLVINNSNSRPACVTQGTMSVLEARGWGHAAP